MRWEQLPQHGPAPAPRSSHTLTVIGTKAYIFGGELVPRTPIDSVVHEYNLNTQTWRTLTASGDIPPATVGPAAAAVGPVLYVFGGREGIEMASGATDALYSFDTYSNKWRRIVGIGQAPEKRSYHAMVSVGDCLYVFGGCGEGGRLNDLHVFNTSDKTWTQLPASSNIAGRGGAGLVATAAGDALYVVAGFCGREMDDMHRFDVARRTWDCPSCCSEEATVEKIPARSVFGIAAHACAACSHGNHLVVYGGEVDPSDEGHSGAGAFSQDTFCFDPDRPKQGWHRLGPSGEVPPPRGWFAADSIRGGLLVHGGNSPTNERLGDMYLLHLHDNE